MYLIRKTFTFSAAHQLHNLPPDHPCSRLHGHNYKVEVLLRSHGLTHNEQWIRDYRELDEFKKYLDDNFDHTNLNSVLINPEGLQTTAENLAFKFFLWCKQHWPETCCVRVSETEKTWAEYYESLDP